MLVKEKRRSRLFIALCLVIAGVLILVCGCDPHTKHKVLSFFFTGVPTPEEMEERRKIAVLEKKVKEEQEKFKREKRMAFKLSLDQQKPTSGPLISTHESYAAGRCDTCHIMTANFTMSRRDGSTHRFGKGGGIPGVLVAPRIKLCIRCHENLSASKAEAMGLWLHTASARGDWNACHDPHQSEYASMLLNVPVAVCLKCHSAKDIVGAKGHEKIENCLGCHNPHLGKDRLRLTKDYKEEKQEPKHLPDVSSPKAQTDGAEKITQPPERH